MRMTLTVATIGVFVVAQPTAHADVSYLSLTVDEIVQGYDTYRIFVNFDNETDNLLAVSGNANIAALEFEASHALFQNEGPLDGLLLGDRPHMFDETGADSWVTIGGNWMAGQSDVSFSPDFLGGDGVASVINGSSFFQADNGGYFDSNPGTPETGSVIIAQFTLPTQLQFAVFQGTLSYGDGSDTPVDQAFAVAFVPAPGAISVLCLMSFRPGTRRRHQPTC